MQHITDFVNSIIARVVSSKDEEGQTLVEYGLILALISIVAIVAMGLVGDEVTAVFDEISGELGGATAS